SPEGRRRPEGGGGAEGRSGQQQPACSDGEKFGSKSENGLSQLHVRSLKLGQLLADVLQRRLELDTPGFPATGNEAGRVVASVEHHLVVADGRGCVACALDAVDQRAADGISGSDEAAGLGSAGQTQHSHAKSECEAFHIGFLVQVQRTGAWAPAQYHPFQFMTNVACCTISSSGCG